VKVLGYVETSPFLILFAVSTVIRFAVPIWYPEYIGQAHLLSSVLYALAVALSVSFLRSVKLPADIYAGAGRWYRSLLAVFFFVACFLIAFYGRMPSL